jgi:hypothetical protein
VYRSTGPVEILTRIQKLYKTGHVITSQRIQCFCTSVNISTGPVLLCTGPKPFPSYSSSTSLLYVIIENHLSTLHTHPWKPHIHMCIRNNTWVTNRSIAPPLQAKPGHLWSKFCLLFNLYLLSRIIFQIRQSALYYSLNLRIFINQNYNSC